MGNIVDRLKRMFIVALKQLQDPYYHGFAAQISFYLILSIVPIIVLITQLLGVFDINMETAVSAIEEYTGSSISSVLKALFGFSSIGAWNIVYFVIALSSGSRASFCISRIANYTLTEGKTTGKNYFLERARAMLTMFITVVTLGLTVIILCYGKIILIGVLHVLNINAESYVDSFWMWFRWPVGFLLYLLMVSVNYYVLPTKKQSFRSILPGSIFAALGMLIVTGAYSIYTSSLVHYDIMYGTLSSVVAILMWFLLLSWVIILGVLVNKVIADTRQPYSKRSQPEHVRISAQQKSKYDIDPDEFGFSIIRRILMGEDRMDDNKR